MSSLSKIFFCTFLSLLVLSNPQALSQPKSSLFRQVVHRFGPGAKGIWVQFYRGKVDDIRPVLFCLGNDGNRYKGFYTYESSPVKYYFEGEITHGQVHWIETDVEGEITGYIQGELTKDHAVLQRLDLSRQFVRDISLQKTRFPRVSKEDCSDGLWVKHLRGHLLDEACTVVLQREYNEILKGVIQFDNTHRSYDLKGQCVDSGCRRLHLHLATPSGTQLGDLLLQSQGNRYLVLAKNDEGSQNSEWETLDSLPVLCAISANGTKGYSYAYPFLEKKNFDRWMGQRFKRWVDQYRTKLGEEEEQYLAEVDDRATAWVDIEYWGAKIVSGFITFVDPLEEVTHREGFVFSYKKKAPLKLANLFEDEGLAKMILQKELQKKKQILLKQSEQGEAEWLTSQGFDAWCVRAEGLCFSTPFSGIYGDRKIIIPFEMVKDIISDKRILRL